MAFMSSRRRAEILDLVEITEDSAKIMVNNYHSLIGAVDDRRYVWILERALDALADEMTELERSIVLADHFGRNEQSKSSHVRFQLLKEDFKLLWALYVLAKEVTLRNFSAGVKEFFTQQKERKK